jgi:flagellum-specific ATP synthase
MSVLALRQDACREAARPRRTGRVARVIGLNFELEGIEAAIGESVRIDTDEGPLVGEVVALGERGPIAMPFGELRGVRVGAPAEPLGRSLEVPVGWPLLGRVVDGLGNPLDDGPSLDALERVSPTGTPPHPLKRARVLDQMHLGVRAIDTLVPCGRGQRLGIFAGSGVGKSSTLSMIVRGTEADVSVLALIGERGREVREFIENDLGPEGMARSVIVCATSDQPALVRIQAAFTATRIAEWYRDQGAHVVLMMDSLTRFCMAQREIGLSVGEVPATRGYPPSVFAMLPRLLERAGAGETGSITGLYTVLVEGDDMNEPIGDAARSILDGHIVLSRALAHANHYPSIDVLESISRVSTTILDKDLQKGAAEVRRLLAAYREAKDLIEIGAYVPGTNPAVDQAVACRDDINRFLQQGLHEESDGDALWPALFAAIGQPGGGQSGTAPFGDIGLPHPGGLPR